MYFKEKKEFPEDHTHAFIVRFWLEPREIKDADPIWRGIIEHVSSGRKLYLKDLSEVNAFITSYLQGNGLMPLNS